MMLLPEFKPKLISLGNRCISVRKDATYGKIGTISVINKYSYWVKFTPDAMVVMSRHELVKVCFSHYLKQI